MVQTLADLQSAKTRSISIEMSEEQLPTPKLDRIRALFETQDFAGQCPIILHLHTKSGSQVYIRTRYTLHPDEHLVHEITQLLPQAKVHFLDRHTTERLLY